MTLNFLEPGKVPNNIFIGKITDGICFLLAIMFQVRRGQRVENNRRLFGAPIQALLPPAPDEILNTIFFKCKKIAVKIVAAKKLVYFIEKYARIVRANLASTFEF